MSAKNTDVLSVTPDSAKEQSFYLKVKPTDNRNISGWGDVEGLSLTLTPPLRLSLFFPAFVVTGKFKSTLEKGLFAVAKTPRACRP